MSVYQEHVCCMNCGKKVSGHDPELGIVVRAYVECPECIEASVAAGDFEASVVSLRAKVKELQAEIEEDDRVRDRMRDLLVGVAEAVHGPPGPLQLHDWSQLPRLVAELKVKAETVGG